MSLVHRRRAVTARAGSVLLVAVLATLAVVLAPVFGPSAPSAWADSGAPDPYASGTVGLCDVHGRPLTVGSVDTRPFTWTAVSSVGAPAAFRGVGENTALTIYQPRPGVDPREWAGDALTAASFYRRGGAPVAQATAKDLSLRDILREFPPADGGLYELRMQFARQDYATASGSYPATLIRVQGDVWSVVDPAPVHCAAGSATSNEVLTGIAPAAPPAHGPLAGAVALPATGGGHAVLVVVVVVLAVAAAGTGGAVLVQRRRSRRRPPLTRPTPVDPIGAH